MLLCDFTVLPPSKMKKGPSPTKDVYTVLVPQLYVHPTIRCYNPRLMIRFSCLYRAEIVGNLVSASDYIAQCILAEVCLRAVAAATSPWQLKLRLNRIGKAIDSKNSHEWTSKIRKICLDDGSSARKKRDGSTLLERVREFLSELNSVFNPRYG